MKMNVKRGKKEVVGFGLVCFGFLGFLGFGFGFGFHFLFIGEPWMDTVSVC